MYNTQWYTLVSFATLHRHLRRSKVLVVNKEMIKSWVPIITFAPQLAFLSSKQVNYLCTFYSFLPNRIPGSSCGSLYLSCGWHSNQNKKNYLLKVIIFILIVVYLMSQNTPLKSNLNCILFFYFLRFIRVQRKSVSFGFAIKFKFTASNSKKISLFFSFVLLHKVSQVQS